MKLAVGYQLPCDEPFGFVDAVRKYKDQIGEVYFPWPGAASGRAVLGEHDGYVDWDAQNSLERDLRVLKDMGIKLDLVLNANCYGGDSLSRRLENHVRSIIDRISEAVGSLDIVTTASPAIAHMIKRSSPGVEVRSSVNMRIGTIKGMQYLADLFDSFHVQREFNRDLEHLAKLKRWADANGKRLIILANSGCMIHCSAQTFHDNLVAHESEIAHRDNIKDWNPHACWRFLKSRENWVCLLQNTWVRPEDIHRYEDLFDVAKLATRMHSNPAMVIGAYATGRYHGNLLDLFEPGFGPALKPWIIDNDSFPEDWFEKTSGCSRGCESCGYCETVMHSVLRDMSDVDGAMR